MLFMVCVCVCVFPEDVLLVPEVAGETAHLNTEDKDIEPVHTTSV